LFSFWSVIRWLSLPTGLSGIKDILWYSLPLFIILFILNKYSNKSGNIIFSFSDGVLKFILLSVLIPALLYIFAFLFGLAKFTWRGPSGLLISTRTISSFLLIILAVSISNKYFNFKKKISTGSLFTSLTLILFSLSRMASAVAIGLFLLRYWFTKQKVKFIIAVIVSIIMAILVITEIPAIRIRFIRTEELDFSFSEGLEGFNYAGRDNFWRTTYNSAIEKPIFGKGLGSARRVTAKLFIGKRDIDEYQPHNEYLQVFHDMGLIGVILLVTSWGCLLLRNLFHWKVASTIREKRWVLATILSIIVVLILSITDNTLHYPNIMTMVSIVISLTELNYLPNTRK